MFTPLRTNFKLVKANASSLTRRNFHPGGKKSSSVLEADSSKQLTSLYHTSGLVLVGLTPLAFILSPSVINMPIDLALGFIFPFHSHIALNYVISDYVPKASRPIARAALLAATVVGAAGILKLNATGPGLTESIKSLWRKPKAKQE
mmetsp:Transcript_33484/g.56172  ORF Transcript_33484/g.56172 Transcript_33484/m.56172 type:complete len:147 (-) Transcript_33484:387-827(-)